MVEFTQLERIEIRIAGKRELIDIWSKQITDLERWILREKKEIKILELDLSNLRYQEGLEEENRLKNVK